MSEDFNKVLNCPGLVFVQNSGSLEKWSSAYNRDYKEIYKGDVRPATENEDIKQALRTMRNVSEVFQTENAPAASFAGVGLTQTEIETTAILGVHNEAFGQNFFENIKSKVNMTTDEKQKLLYFGQSVQAMGADAYIQTAEDYDLTMLIGWSYALLKWYSEYGKAKDWTHKGKGFVEWVAGKNPEDFDKSDNLEEIFNSSGQEENTVRMDPNTTYGQDGAYGAVVTIPIKRNLKDHKDQLPDVDKYWVSDVVSLQLQGLTPNYTSFGAYNGKADNVDRTRSLVNHWWYRRDFWGNYKLLGFEPSKFGNVKSGPWRPIELKGLYFNQNNRKGMEMPYTYGEAEDLCGTFRGGGIQDEEKTWEQRAAQVKEYSDRMKTKAFTNREPYRFFGKNEPEIQLFFPFKKTWQRNMSLDVADGGPFKHNQEERKINANQFVEGAAAPFIDGFGKDDWELLMYFGAFPNADKKSVADGWQGNVNIEDNLRTVSEKSKFYNWKEFDGDAGLLSLLSNGPALQATDGVYNAPNAGWWQYKWEHMVRPGDFGAIAADNNPGVCLGYGSLLNPYFGVQFCGPTNTTFRTVFVLVAKIVSWFYKIGPKLQFPDMQDLLGGKNEAAVWRNYRFLQAFVTRIILNSRLKHDDIEEIRKQNTEIAKANPSLVVTEEKAMKTRLQENAQCFLINAISTFQEKRANDSAYTGYRNSPVFYNTVHGDTNAFINLLGFKKDVIHTFLNLKTSEAAFLQPRIRLYKQRTDFSTGKDEWVTVDVPGPFESALNKKSVRNVLERSGGRLPGSGIKEINMEQRDGNASVNLIETKDVEITFHFNTLEEIFLNYPQYKGDGSKPSYPFGKTPGVRKNKNGLLPVASVAELVFPVTKQIIGGEFNLQDFNNRANPDFRVILELGWTLPDSLATTMGKGSNKFIKEIKKQNPFHSIVLMPYDSEINIRQNGTIELKVKYRGIEENIMATPSTRLFPQAAGLLSKLAGDEKNLPDGLKEIAKQIKQNIEKIKEITKKRKDKKKALSSKDSKDLKVAEGKVNTLLAEAQDKQMQNFMDRDIQELYKAMIDSGYYHRIAIPSALIGRTNQYEVDGKTKSGVLKYRPVRNVDDFKNFRINKTAPTGGNSKSAITAQMKAKIEQAKRITQEKNTDKYKEGEKAGQLNKENDTTFTIELQKLLRDSFFAGTADEFSEPVDFMYFGDILYVIYDHMLNARKTGTGAEDLIGGINNFTNERVTFILGSVKTPHISGDKLEYRNVNIGDIPVAMGIFNRFVIDYVIAKKNYNVSYIDFVVSFYKSFMQKYYSQLCFDLGIGADAFSPEVKFFEMFRETDKKIDLSKLSTNKSLSKGFVFPPEGMPSFKTLGESPQVFKNKEEVKARMKKYETSIKFGKGKNYNTHPYFSYCYLGGQTIGSQNRDFAEDLKNNIHHFYIGRDRGIVKNIDFSARDVKGRAESAYFSSNALEKGMFMIPRVYDVSVTMVGNNFFQSGQTFYVNPTLGMATKGKKLEIDLIKNSGLGGYYYVGKVVTNISAQGYETTLEGIKVLLSHQENEKSKTHTSASKSQVKKVNKRKKKK